MERNCTEMFGGSMSVQNCSWLLSNSISRLQSFLKVWLCLFCTVRVRLYNIFTPTIHCIELINSDLFGQFEMFIIVIKWCNNNLVEIKDVHNVLMFWIEILYSYILWFLRPRPSLKYMNTYMATCIQHRWKFFSIY